MPQYLQRPHNIQQAFIVFHIMILNLICGDFIEYLLGTGNFGLLDRLEIQAVHGSFDFRDEGNMLDRTALEGDSLIRGIIA